MAALVPSRRGPARFALGSLALHALLLSLGTVVRAPTAERKLPASPVAELEVDVPPPTSDLPELDGSSEPAPSVQAPSEQARVARAAAVPRGAAPASAAGETEEGGTPEAPPADGAGAEAGPSPSGASTSGAPPLSLAQLGVGDGNSFLIPSDPAALRAEKTARVQRRLDRALAQGLHDQDIGRGRGAGSPVMRALEAAVYASTAPLNGGANFIFVIDSEGKLLSSTVGATSGDREAWARAARKAAQSLAQRKLPVPKGKSVRLTVAVSSHLELPSGADPGVALDVLGVPISKGGGPRSTKVDLLNPRNPLSPLTLAGDPADIGQKARRMVHAHVVSEELL